MRLLSPHGFQEDLAQNLGGKQTNHHQTNFTNCPAGSDLGDAWTRREATLGCHGDLSDTWDLGSASHSEEQGSGQQAGLMSKGRWRRSSRGVIRKFRSHPDPQLFKIRDINIITPCSQG